MADLEKVIQGLASCREMENPPGWRVGGCWDCPYEPLKGKVGCTKKLKEDAKELLKEFKSVGGWISVKDRLPEIDERVLVFGVGKYEHFVGSTMTAITCMSDANLIDCHLKTQPYWLEPWQYYLTDYEITHWMPLPEGPKEEDDD